MSDNNDAVREALARRVAELEKREQEMAAHVEKIEGSVIAALDATEFWSHHHTELRKAIDRKPEISLDHLKAKWQAEAFVSYAKRIAECNEPDDMECIEDIYGALMRQAAELRRQSQEPTQ